MTDTTMYLLLAAMIGILVALVLSIRRLTSLELKSEAMISATKRIEAKDIEIDQKVLDLGKQIVLLLKPKKKAK